MMRSTNANTITPDLMTTNGFKNIQDYLQEANLYSAQKEPNSASDTRSLN